MPGDRSGGFDDDLDPFDRREHRDVEVELGDVLVEQPELVVVYVGVVAGCRNGHGSRTYVPD